MNLRDIQELVGQFAPVIKEAIAEATAPILVQLAAASQQIVGLDTMNAVLVERLQSAEADVEDWKKEAADLTRQLGETVALIGNVQAKVNALPTPRDGKDAEPVAIEPIVAAVLASIELPEPAAVDYEAVKRDLAVMVGDAVASLPPAAPGKDGEDGRSLSVDDVRPMIAELAGDWSKTLATEFSEAVAALPAPVDGKSVTLEDVAPLIDSAVGQAASLIPGFVKDQIALARIDEKIAEKVAEIPAPAPGKSITLEDVAPLINSGIELAASALPGLVSDAVKAEGIDAKIQSAVDDIPRPRDGTSVTVEDVAPLVSEELAKAKGLITELVSEGFAAADLDGKVKAAVAALPPAEDGKSVTSSGVTPLIRELVDAEAARLPALVEVIVSGVDFTPGIERAVAALPPPKDGASVTAEDLRPMVEETVGKAVDAIPKPKDGKDGAAAAGAVIDRDGNLVITLADGLHCNLGRVVGKDVDEAMVVKTLSALVAGLEPAKDGADGVGFDDMDLQHDGERRFVLRFVKGDKVKEFPFKIAAVLDRGVFREGGTYEKGDSVTYGGSTWIAQEWDMDPAAVPGKANSWRLSVKKGRDLNAPAPLSR